MGASDNHQHFDPASYNTAFAISVGLNLLFVIIEAGYAIVAGSMSLLADAGHNLGDVLGLIFAWIANWLVSRGAGEKFSYGHRKSTILAALANALLLVGTSVLIGYESINKLFHPSEVNEMIVIIVALIGIAINGGTALLFLQGRHDDLNIKGAFLHLAYDALISLGVVIAGIIIYFFGWQILDPIVGLLIVIVILIGTWGLLRDSVNLILDAVPHHIDQAGVREYLLQLPGVSALHDLHIWGLSTSETALTAHLIIKNSNLSDEVRLKAMQDLHQKFKIDHVTLQVEQGDSNYPCPHGGSC